jgi:transcriptional regulator with XRE-family HTH domain
MTRGQALRRARERRAWSLRQLARRSGVAVEHLIDWERDQPPPRGLQGPADPAAAYARVCQQLGLAIEEP